MGETQLLRKVAPPYIVFRLKQMASSIGVDHEETEEETVLLYDAPGSTTPPCTGYLCFCGGLFGLLRPGIFRLATAVATSAFFMVEASL